MLSRRFVKRGVAAVAVLLVSIVSARADDAAALKDRLHAAEKETSLSADDVQPFYLKMSVQLFDAKGQPSEQGTVELYWKDKDRQKRVYTFPSYTASEVHVAGKTFRTADAKYPPQTVALLVDQMIRPMPGAEQVDASQPQMLKVKFDKSPLECIMLAKSVSGQAPIPPMGLFPTYCFDPGTSVLRVSSNFGGQIILRNMTSTFQQRHVAMDVVISERQVAAAEGKLEKLEERDILDADIATDGLVLARPAAVRVSSGVIAGMALSQPPPVYPAIARARHLQGVVVLHARIGKDGSIQDLEVVYSPDPALSAAAMDAVRQWRYKPYLLGGEPVDVETSINVNFTSGR